MNLSFHASMIFYKTLLFLIRRGSNYIMQVKSLSHVQLFVTPWTLAFKAPLSMGFPRQDYWSGLSSPSQEDLPDPKIEPWYPTLQGDSSPCTLLLATNSHIRSLFHSSKDIFMRLSSDAGLEHRGEETTVPIPLIFLLPPY